MSVHAAGSIARKQNTADKQRDRTAIFLFRITKRHLFIVCYNQFLNVDTVTIFIHLIQVVPSLLGIKCNALNIYNPLLILNTFINVILSDPCNSPQQKFLRMVGAFYK